MKILDNKQNNKTKNHNNKYWIANEENIKSNKQCKKIIIKLSYWTVFRLSSYNHELNLSYLNVLKKYTPLVGYSDHSNSDLACLISVALGAKVIEKHFILNKRVNSPDKSFSYDPIQFKSLVNKIRIVEDMLGNEKIDKKKILKGKLKTVTRSIFYSSNIKKGEKISVNNIKSVRPGTGLKLSYFNKILGKQLLKNVKFGQPVKLNHLK